MMLERSYKPACRLCSSRAEERRGEECSLYRSSEEEGNLLPFYSLLRKIVESEHLIAAALFFSDEGIIFYYGGASSTEINLFSSATANVLKHNCSLML